MYAKTKEIDPVGGGGGGGAGGAPLDPPMDNILSRALNGIVYSINTRNKIPKVIVLILDHNFVKYHFMADAAIAWLYRQINRNFQARWDQLPPRARPLGFSLPTVMVVKPVTRPW